MELTELSICTRSFSLRLTTTGVSSNSLLLLSDFRGGRGKEEEEMYISKQMTDKTGMSFV